MNTATFSNFARNSNASRSANFLTSPLDHLSFRWMNFEIFFCEWNIRLPLFPANTASFWFRFIENYTHIGVRWKDEAHQKQFYNHSLNWNTRIVHSENFRISFNWFSHFKLYSSFIETCWGKNRDRDARKPWKWTTFTMYKHFSTGS